MTAEGGPAQRTLLTRARSAPGRWARDRPAMISVGLSVIVVAHALLSQQWPRLSPYDGLQTPEQTGTAVAIYAGTTAAAAVVAGFAAVVLIFTIGAQNPRIRVFRDRGGASLRRNWIVVVTEPFTATFASIVAAVAQTVSGGVLAPWLFELAVILLVHGAVRLVWLLHELVEIVAADDTLVVQQQQTIPVSAIFPPSS